MPQEPDPILFCVRSLMGGRRESALSCSSCSSARDKATDQCKLVREIPRGAWGGSPLTRKIFLPPPAPNATAAIRMFCFNRMVFFSKLRLGGLALQHQAQIPPPPCGQKENCWFWILLLSHFAEQLFEALEFVSTCVSARYSVEPRAECNHKGVCFVCCL